MALTHLELQSLAKHCVTKVTKTQYAWEKTSPEDWNPFYEYFYIRRRTGIEWYKYHPHWEPNPKIINEGHFASLPDGYITPSEIVYDSTVPLHICTIGGTNPMDMEKWEPRPNAKDKFDMPEYRVAVLASDVKLFPKSDNEDPDGCKYIEMTKEALSEYFQWCIDNGEQPLRGYSGSLREVWETAWRTSYGDKELDAATLEKLSYIKCKGNYYRIERTYAAPKLIRPPQGHLLHDYIGVPYSELSNTLLRIKTNTSGFKTVIRTGERDYYFEEGALQLGDAWHSFYVHSYPMGGENYIEVPATEENIRHIMKTGRYFSQPLHFNTNGNLLIRDGEFYGILQPKQSLLTRFNDGHEVLLLAEGDEQWKPVDKKFCAKFDVKIVTAYRTYGGDYCTPLKVCNIKQDIKCKETGAQRAKRLGAEKYKAEIQLHRHTDYRILRYVEFSKEAERGAYVKIFKNSPLISDLQEHASAPNTRGINWFAWAQQISVPVYSGVERIIRRSGAGETVCGVIFLKSEYATLPSALMHISGLETDSALHRYLSGILSACAEVGMENIKQILLTQL